MSITLSIRIANNDFTMKIKLLLLVLAIFFSTTAQAQLFRWIDDQGVVHYSDRIPQQDAKRQHKVLGNNAQTVEVVSAQKTQEELAAEHRLLLEQQEQERLAKEQRMKDATLLRTFGSVADIDRILNDRISSIQNNINLIQTKIGKIIVKLKESEKKRAGFVEREQLVPVQLAENIREYRGQISKLQDKVGETRQMQEDITARFSEDKKRFIFLKEKQIATN